MKKDLSSSDTSGTIGRGRRRASTLETPARASDGSDDDGADQPTPEHPIEEAMDETMRSFDHAKALRMLNSAQANGGVPRRQLPVSPLTRARHNHDNIDRSSSGEKDEGSRTRVSHEGSRHHNHGPGSHIHPGQTSHPGSRVKGIPNLNYSHDHSGSSILRSSAIGTRIGSRVKLPPESSDDDEEAQIGGRSPPTRRALVEATAEFAKSAFDLLAMTGVPLVDPVEPDDLVDGEDEPFEVAEPNEDDEDWVKAEQERLEEEFEEPNCDGRPFCRHWKLQRCSRAGHMRDFRHANPDSMPLLSAHKTRLPLQNALYFHQAPSSDDNRIAVIIACYNEEWPELHRTLCSLSRQRSPTVGVGAGRPRIYDHRIGT